MPLASVGDGAHSRWFGGFSNDPDTDNFSLCQCGVSCVSDTTTFFAILEANDDVCANASASPCGQTNGAL